MIRLTAPVLVSVVLALCGGCGAANHAGTRGSESYLISSSEVAPGWSQVPDTILASDPGLCGHPQAAIFNGRAPGAEAVVLSSIDKANVIEQVVIEKDEQEARRLVDEVRTQAGACTEFDTVVGKLPIHDVLSNLTMPLAGDEQVTYRETASFVGGVAPILGATYVQQVIVRRGGIVMALSLASSELSAANDALFNKVLDLAFKKLSRL